MDRSELYEDLSEIIVSYQYQGALDTNGANLDASDLFRMLTRIHANWSSIVTE